MSIRYPLLNRELGILGFNERVLAQAADPAVPLLERLRFICITSSNLDEFFEIRMAGLQEQLARYTEAHANAARAVALFEELSARHPADLRQRLDWTFAEQRLGSILISLNNLPAALEAFESHVAGSCLLSLAATTGGLALA